MRIEGVIATTGMVAQQPPQADTQTPRDSTQAANVVANAQQDAKQGNDAKPVGQQMLDNAVHQVNQIVNQFDQGIEFKVHKDPNTIVITVFNKSTGEIIRQIPSEKFLDMISAFQKQLSGLMVDENR